MSRDSLKKRVLNLKEVDANTKEMLVKLRDSIDIVNLSEGIERLSEEVIDCL